MEQEMNEEELIADDLMEDETPVEEEVIETDYFAVEEADALGPLLVEKVNDYYDHLQGTGKLALWRRVFEKYYRGVWHDGQILEAGEQGEYSLLYVNQFRNFIQNLLTLTTSTPPWFEPQSTHEREKNGSQP